MAQASVTFTLTVNQQAALVISGPSVGAVGQPIEIDAVGSGGITPYVYSETGLPPGMSIDPATGKMTGTPTAAGTYTITASF
jgi:hypothetical protein